MVRSVFSDSPEMTPDIPREVTPKKVGKTEVLSSIRIGGLSRSDSLESLTDIELISSGSMESLALDRTSPDLKGRVSPFVPLFQNPEDDPRAPSPRLRIEAEHVNAWKSPVQKNHAQVTNQLRLENANLWQRLKNTVTRFLLLIFRPGLLPERQMQQALYSLFDETVTKMKSQTPLQNNLLLCEIEQVCFEAAKEAKLATEEEKIRWLDGFESQIKLFLSKQENVLELSTGQSAAEYVVDLAAVLVAATRKGLDYEAESRAEESLDLSMTLSPRSECSRYIVSVEGKVKECTTISDRLQPGEIDFFAYKSVAVDIFRDGAQINGKIYFSLEETVAALRDLGVKPDALGDMISLFAQNLFNTLTIPVALGYDLVNAPRPVMPGAQARFRGLEIDPIQQTYRLSAKLVTHTSGPPEKDKDDAILKALSRDMDFYDAFFIDLQVYGELGQDHAFSSFEQHHVLHSFLERKTNAYDGIKASSAFLSKKTAVFRKAELEVLKKEAEKWKKVSQAISHAKKQVKAVSGLRMDDLGVISAVSKGAKRRRTRQASARYQAEEALARVRLLQQAVVASKERGFQAKTLSELETLAKEVEGYCKTIEAMTYAEMEQMRDHPAHIWALRILNEHYESLRA